MPLRDREQYNAYNHAWYRRNKKKVVAKVSDRRRVIVKWVRDYKTNNPCTDCHIVYPYYVMDLDHREGVEKIGNLSALVRTKGLKTVQDEVAKCDLVCANCHRERTFSRIA